jgi:hypothetical protein
MHTNKSDIPKEVLDTFNAFKQAIETNLETVNKCGTRFHSFSGSFSKTVGQIYGSKIKPNHNFLESYAGSKGFYNFNRAI